MTLSITGLQQDSQVSVLRQVLGLEQKIAEQMFAQHPTVTAGQKPDGEGSSAHGSGQSLTEKGRHVDIRA